MLQLHLCPENRGENSVFASPIHQDAVSVPACRIDDRVGDRSVAVVKIDVQGAEPGVIRGMRETIRRNPGLQIMCECSPSDLALGGVSVDEFLSTLRELGLSAVRMDRQPYAPVASASDLADLASGSYRQCDLLCRPIA